MSNLIASGSRLTPARLGAAWTAWTPGAGSLWTATTANPSLGNGSYEAFFRQMSTTVTYTGRITMGSTTTFGTGGWRLLLPIAAVSSGVGVGSALAYDSSNAGGRKPMVVWLAGATTLRINGDTGDVDGSNPFTWATGDQLRWTFEYEAVDV